MAFDHQLSNFQVNDTYSFTRLFTEKDFAEFSMLSGDQNLLHHDVEYASRTSFEFPIVPVHLVAAPLSAIAGMVFPGERSLYLSHQLKALKPVPYHLELTYSAKIIGIDDSNNILTIRTLVFNGCDVYVEAEQKIQVRQSITSNSVDQPSWNNGSFVQPEKCVLVTGANGGLGRCVAQKLSSKGYKLVLQVRTRNDGFEEFLASLNQHTHVLECDLRELTSDSFASGLQSLPLVPSYVIHCASAPLMSEADDLFRVNYSSMRYITDTLLPFWFKQQFGKLVFVSSSALHFYPEGWEDYSAAKAAGISYCSSIDHRFRSVGITAGVLAPGLFESGFSENINIDRRNAMIPEQVADEVVNKLEDSNTFYTWVEESESRHGRYGFTSTVDVDSAILKDQSPTHDTNPSLHQLDAGLKESNVEERLKELIRGQLKLEAATSWREAGVSVTPGWDSLNHMLLLVEIERVFSLSISSMDIDRTSTFLKLLELVKEKLTH